MRRYLFRRFLKALSFFTLLLLAVLTAFIVLLLGPLRFGQSTSAVLLVVICGLPVLVLMVIFVVAGSMFSRIGPPLADVMAAADAVAEGDLSVRVREQGGGQVARLARSFNHMTDELQRAEQQRRNITADIAHELRTPLHIIQGNLEGLLDGVYEPTPDHIGATLEETQLLGRLVGDLQTLSLAEAGALPLHPSRVSATDLLADIATSFSAAATEHGVELRLEAGDGEAFDLWVDADRIDQVLSNLVGNALRYTAPGGAIVLTAKPVDDRVRLSVADTGAGIAAEDLPYIFDRFWRGDKARTRGATGSGLGLAIARQLVLAHDGTIRVESEPGKGTTFIVELPQAPLAEPDRASGSKG